MRLLTRDGVDRNTVIDDALIQAVQEQDHNLIHHLIKSGADPNHNSGKSVLVAAEQTDLKSLRILAAGQVPRKVYSIAFRTIVDDQKTVHVNRNLLHEVSKHLLQQGAAGPPMDHKLLECMSSQSPLARDFVNCAMAYRSAMNVDYKGGKCLCIAAKCNDVGMVGKLLDLEPNESTLQSAFCALFESDASEESLLTTVGMFLKQAGERTSIYFEEDEPSMNPLYITLHRHQDMTELLQHLLDHGCSANARFTWNLTHNHRIDRDHGMEEVFALLWLLCQDSSPDMRILEILLSNGGKSSLRNRPLSVVRW